jgi:hypothetical protein
MGKDDLEGLAGQASDTIRLPAPLVWRQILL